MDFLVWLKSAKPRAQFSYHRGMLVKDRLADRKVHAVANSAAFAEECGKVFLLQRKIAHNVYDYLAIKRRA